MYHRITHTHIEPTNNLYGMHTTRDCTSAWVGRTNNTTVFVVDSKASRKAGTIFRIQAKHRYF